MEVGAESEFSEYELMRERNRIENHEFMVKCGLSLKTLPSVEHSGKGQSLDNGFVPKNSDKEDSGRASSSDEHKARRCRETKEKTKVSKKKQIPGQ